MEKILFMFVALSILFGCNKDDNQESDKQRGQSSSTAIQESSGNTCNGNWSPPKTGNYMDSYIIPTKFELGYEDTIFGYDWAVAIDPTFTIFYCNGEIYSYDTEKNDKAGFAKYNEYASYYGDTSYTWYHNTSVIENGSAIPINSITIVANKDFDEVHPAGTSLNDLFSVKYYAFHSFIKNNFKNIYAGKDESVDYYPMDSVMLVSDFKEVSLFNNQAKFYLIKRPAKGKYTFTFTLNFGEDPLTGEKVDVPPASIEVEF